MLDFLIDNIFILADFVSTCL